MKKEYLILVALIIILGLYLALKDTNRDSTDLPVIDPVDIKTITRLEIKKAGKDLVFNKTGDDWTVSKKAYPADAFLVNNMLAIFKSFKLSALVTEEGVPERYELDDAHRIDATLYTGDNKLFTLKMGKTAPSFNHTFVQVSDDPAVYHASGSFRSHFEKQMAEYRDKKVLAFKNSELKQMTLTSQDKTLVLKQAKETDEKEQTFVFWRHEDGTNAKGETMKSFLTALNYLECDNYSDKPVKTVQAENTPICHIQLQTENKAYELFLFDNPANQNYMGISSMNNYTFFLDQNKGKNIIANVQKLLGIETADNL